MIRYCVSYTHYKDFFNEEFIIEDGYEDEFFYLDIICLENKEDREWEYSLKWINYEMEEVGFKYGINTSSIFSLYSCDWGIDEEEDEDEENDLKDSLKYKIIKN